jgi:hypothetical protein
LDFAPSGWNISWLTLGFAQGLVDLAPSGLNFVFGTSLRSCCAEIRNVGNTDWRYNSALKGRNHVSPGQSPGQGILKKNQSPEGAK